MFKQPIIPVFLPYSGCTHRCIFCNQKAISKDSPSPEAVKILIEKSIRDLSLKNLKIQVAFYGGSFTAMPLKDQLLYLRAVNEFILKGEIESVRISTRPDSLNDYLLHILKEYNVKTIEIGAQSMFDEVLSLSQRGHTSEETITALQRLKAFGFEVGVHLMIGLPGDTKERFFKTLDIVIELRPNFIRIHPTLVLKDSLLEKLWRSSQYLPLPLDEAIKWLKGGILKLENASIPVARIGLQPTRELEEYILAGPYHPALHHLVESSIFFDMLKEVFKKNNYGNQLTFICNPKDESNLRGQRNSNISRLKEMFSLKDLTIKTSETLEKGSIVIRSGRYEASINRKELRYSNE